MAETRIELQNGLLNCNAFQKKKLYEVVKLCANLRQLCLAHYCDTHGPTPLMVTEESPVSCSTCYEERASPAPPTALPDTPLPSTAVSRNASFDQREQPNSQSQSRLEIGTGAYTPNTPPASPRIQALAPPKQHSRRDSSFRKTYDDADRKRAIPCENCALTLPKQVSAAQAQQSSSPKDSIPEGPILKTRQPCALIRSKSSFTSSPHSGSERSDSEGDVCESDAAVQPSSQGTSTKSRRKSLRRSITLNKSATSSTTSFDSDLNNAYQHAHYIDYTSAHDPVSSASFSLLRAACLRTLSCETLPPPRPSFTPAPSAVASPTSPFNADFKTSLSSSMTSSATVGSSGGPLLFGDPRAGYTTAFIFRIPDPCARGRRRQYAFICLSRTGERKAVRAFGMLSQVFRELAAWVQSLAEGEADRLCQESDSNNSTPGGASGYSAGLREARANSVNGGGGEPRSSFLSGRQGGGFEQGGLGGMGGIRGVRSRGLAELVGQPDFFLQLHVKFVEILARLRFLMEGS